MRPAHLTPITDAEVQHAVNALKRYPNGLTRADLERVFGTDRAVLHETLTELVEAVLEVELPQPLDDTTRDLLKGAMRRHPELATALTGEEHA